MALKLFLNLDAAPGSAFVQSFYDATPVASLGSLFRDSSKAVEIHALREASSGNISAGRPFVYADVSAEDLSVGAGVIGQKPFGGTWTLTDPDFPATTAPMPYNATAAEVEAALRLASAFNWGDATVSGPDGGPYTIRRNVPGDLAALEGDSVALEPANSTILSNKVQTGSVDYGPQCFVELVRAIAIGRSSGWSALPAAAVVITTHQAGDATHCKTFKVAWNTDAYGGDVTLSFFGNAVTKTLPAVGYDATAEQVAAAFATHSQVATAAGVSVQKVQRGLYFVTCVAAAIDFDNAPTLTAVANSLQVPIGRTAPLQINTEGVAALFAAGETTADVTVEVRLGDEVAATVAGVVELNLIRSVQGVSDPLDPSLRRSQMETLYPVLLAYTTGLNGLVIAKQSVASAATTTLGALTPIYLNITGTTGITSFGSNGGGGPILKLLRFAGNLTITNGASMILPGGAPILALTGDHALFVGETGGVWTCIAYWRAATAP